MNYRFLTTVSPCVVTAGGSPVLPGSGRPQGAVESVDCRRSPDCPRVSPVGMGPTWTSTTT